MNLYIALLKAFLKFSVFNKYYSSLNLDFVEKNYPELFKLFNVLPELHARGVDKEYSTLDLKLCLLKAYPKADPVFYDRVFTDIEEQQVDPVLVEDYIREIAERNQALETAKLAIKASEGLGSLTEVKQFLERQELSSPVSNWRNDIVTHDLRTLLDQTFKASGLRWRLKSLNVALGSLRRGDFGFVFARPETGKTTFLASEMSHMAEQLPENAGPILWFNNEEGGGKVQIRCYQAILGLTVDEIRSQDPDVLQKRFLEMTRGKLQIVNNKSMTKSYVESVCEGMKPSVIIFDQIDKITGFQADRNDLELKELYGWARALAEKYGPTIAVCQAGATGDNKMWLTMNDVDSSKTSKQGEADWILGIGYVFDPGKEYIRYFHLSKNKLFGDEDSDPSMRHGKWACFIKPEVARYKDFNEDGTL